MADLGFWTLNDVIWVKTNPMPNFSGTRFQNAHETLIWAKKSKDQRRYTFNYHSMKALNEDLQMRSDWEIPLCTGKERIKVDGEKAHSTQKPEALLRRVILSSSNVGDLVLDPFFGTGTTGVVAKRYKRNWIGIEVERRYVDIAEERLEGTVPVDLPDEHLMTPSKRDLPKVSFGQLLEVGLLRDGQHLFSASEGQSALICADGTLATDDARGSIHKVGALVQGKKACNGWDYWYFKDDTGRLVPIEDLRNEYRRVHLGHGSG
jgi:site-specific DNA-methyltransferase (adenine-specific)/modification methylase